MLTEYKLGLSVGANSLNLNNVDHYGPAISLGSKTGYCLEADISRQDFDFYLTQAGINYNHMNYLHLKYSKSDESYTINSCNAIFSLVFGIEKIGLYFVPGVFTGYLNCKLTGFGYDRHTEIFEIPNIVKFNETAFSGFDFGYSGWRYET